MNRTAMTEDLNQGSLEDEQVDLQAPIDDTPGDPEESVQPEPVETPEPADAPASFRDILSQQGVDLSAYQDDNAAIEHIAKQIQESQQVRQQADQLGVMAKYGQQYLENAGKFQQWQEEQARQQAAQQASAEVDPYAPPEMNPAWLNQVERNADGGLTPINGGTPETALKVQKYLQWKQEYDANPYKHMEGFVDRRAEARAKELVSSEMEKMRQQLTAEMFVTNNRSWLFEEGKYNSDGAPQLTGRGEAFRGYLAEGTNLGLPAQAAQDLAMSRLRQWDQIQQFQVGQTENSAPPVDKKEDFLQKAAGFSPNHDASTNNKSAKPPEEQGSQNENQTLDEAMRAALKSAKITDEDISGLLV